MHFTTKTLLVLCIMSSTLLLSGCRQWLSQIDPPEMQLELPKEPTDSDSIMDSLDNSFIAPGEGHEGTGEPTKDGSILEQIDSDDPGQGLIEGVTNNGYKPDSEEGYGEPDYLDGIKFEKAESLTLCYDENLQPIPCEDEEPRDDDETEVEERE